LIDDFHWFLEHIPSRINILTQAVRSSPDYAGWINDFTPTTLDGLGQWFYEHVETRMRTEDEINGIYAHSPGRFRNIEIPKYELTNQTFSLAIDVGMYLSWVMEKNVPGLHWKLITRSTNNVYYQQPVLVGRSKLVFCPIHLIVTYAYGVSDHSKGPEVLREIYETWAYILPIENWLE
jgi:hypothetical protein